MLFCLPLDILTFVYMLYLIFLLQNVLLPVLLLKYPLLTSIDV